MGILDMLTSVMAARAAKELDPAVIPAILGEVLGSGGAGGLSAIVAKLQQAGLGDQVKSWIGNGTIRPECLRTASNSAIRPASPAKNPARYEARLEILDRE